RVPFRGVLKPAFAQGHVTLEVLAERALVHIGGYVYITLDIVFGYAGYFYLGFVVVGVPEGYGVPRLYAQGIGRLFGYDCRTSIKPDGPAAGPLFKTDIAFKGIGVGGNHYRDLAGLFAVYRRAAFLHDNHALARLIQNA